MIDIAVTSMPVAGPKIIRLARDIPKFTDTLPVFGRGAERLSEAKMRAPNKPTPNKEIFLYLKSIKIEEAIPAKKTKKTYDNNPALFPSSFNRNPSFYFLNIGIILFLT